MISQYLSAMWPILPAIGNHLWQSTVFFGVAALLTLTLRNYRARARYWVWFAASLKFLLPFSLLVGLGTHLAWFHTSPKAPTTLYFAMAQVSQPFTSSAAPALSATTHPSMFAGLIHLLPAVLVAVWLCGFLTVVFLCLTRWRQISATMQEAVLIQEGRELELLREAEHISGIRHPIEMRLSRASLEPQVLGIVRPILIWPRSISAHLDDAHLAAILAHELCHVRRRDNLAAAIHMVVEAVFWFYLPVWWVGARMLDERERACDEEVLELGADRQVYAESILRICKFCVGSPLACVSGVTGADLKKRIVRIVTDHLAIKLSPARQIMLAFMAVVALVGPMLFGAFQPLQVRAQTPQAFGGPPPHLEAVSIKRDTSNSGMHFFSFQDPAKLTVTSQTPKDLIEFAYNVPDEELSGGPSWINSERFTIDARVPNSIVERERNFSIPERLELTRSMLQSLLADYFGLKLSHEARALPAYALVVAEGGPKFQEAKLGEQPRIGVGGPPTRFSPNQPTTLPLELSSQDEPMPALAQALSGQMGRVVEDKTGLGGKYDLTLKWSVTSSAPPQAGNGETPSGMPALSGSPGSSIFSAIEQQLGLKLEPQQARVSILVIDHIEEPVADKP